MTLKKDTMTMSQILDILRKILDNPKAKVKDLLTESDLACIRMTVGGPTPGKK